MAASDVDASVGRGTATAASDLGAMVPDRSAFVSGQSRGWQGGVGAHMEENCKLISRLLEHEGLDGFIIKVID